MNDWQFSSVMQKSLQASLLKESNVSMILPFVLHSLTHKSALHWWCDDFSFTLSALSALGKFPFSRWCDDFSFTLCASGKFPFSKSGLTSSDLDRSVLEASTEMKPKQYSLWKTCETDWQYGYQTLFPVVMVGSVWIWPQLLSIKEWCEKLQIWFEVLSLFFL